MHGVQLKSPRERAFLLVQLADLRVSELVAAQPFREIVQRDDAARFRAVAPVFELAHQLLLVRG